jgi:non-ribosomal peptide synthase protein (TIGR01720 family)
VIDGLSWRILLEDLAAGYQQAMQQQKIQFPPKTTSFQTWATQLYAYGHDPRREEEWRYWREIENKIEPLFPPSTKVSLPNVETMELLLDEQETETLLYQVHHAYQTEIQDLLLTAWVLAIRDVCQQTTIAMQLEGHGREVTKEEMDVTRTIGWFTSLYPVVFQCEEASLEKTIKEVKETLRQIPNKGIGYGIGKYLLPSQKTGLAEQEKMPDICFNYLGEFREQTAGEFELSTMPVGEAISHRNQSVFALEMNCVVVKGQLRENITYRGPYPAEIQNLVQKHHNYLQQIILHCMEKEETDWTPSDFDAKELTFEELETVFEELEKSGDE